MLFSLSMAVAAIAGLSSAADVVGPTSAYQIYEAMPDLSFQVLGGPNNDGGNSTGNSTNNAMNTYNVRRNMARRIKARSVMDKNGEPFDFYVSQDANNANRQDLVVSFADLPCPPASYGAYSFEFDFNPNDPYSSIGEGQINMFKINGDLPANPTYNDIEAVTGSLIGTFELPDGPDAAPQVFFLNQLVCEPTISLRFGLTQYSNQAGSVFYFNQQGMGLRERSAQ